MPKEGLGVLVVEHRQRVADRLKGLLEILGHRVVGWVTDGHQATVAARRLQPDLILIESTLPGLSGIDATRAIVSERAVPVVLVTPYAAADLHRRAREAGALAYVKPSDGRELRSAIETALERFRELGFVRREVSDPSEEPGTRELAERAKKVLMTRLKLSEAEAFRLIQQRSRLTRTDLRKTAGTILGLDALVAPASDLARCVEVVLQTVERDLNVRRPDTPSAEKHVSSLEGRARLRRVPARKRSSPGSPAVVKGRA